MHTKFVEVGNGFNWGKFLLCTYSRNELRERSQYPGCEDERRPLVYLHGHPATEEIWVLDLATGEGVRFPTGSTFTWDVQRQLAEHRVWVCPMFEPFVAWLFEFISDRPAHWWTDLPRTVELDVPGALFGYRRPGPPAADTMVCTACSTVRPPDDVARGYCGNCRNFLTAPDPGHLEVPDIRCAAGRSVQLTGRWPLGDPCPGAAIAHLVVNGEGDTAGLCSRHRAEFIAGPPATPATSRSQPACHATQADPTNHPATPCSSTSPGGPSPPDDGPS